MEEEDQDRDPGEVYIWANYVEDCTCEECGIQPLETDYCFSCGCCGSCCACLEEDSKKLCPNCKTEVYADTICGDCGGCEICVCQCGRAVKHAEVILCPSCSDSVNFDDVCDKCGNCIHGCCNCMR